MGIDIVFNANGTNDNFGLEKKYRIIRKVIFY